MLNYYSETEYDHRFLEGYLPIIIKQLEVFTQELKRSNDLKETKILKRIANEIAPQDYRIAQVLDVFVQQTKEYMNNYCTECKEEKVLEVVGTNRRFIKAFCPDCGAMFDLVR